MAAGPRALHPWLRLTGYCNVAHRGEVSSALARAIDASGAYLRDVFRYSDMQTVFNIWELPPAGIERLAAGFASIEHFRLSDDARYLLDDQMELCRELVAQGARLPPYVHSNLAVYWQGAGGNVRNFVIASP